MKAERGNVVNTNRANLGEVLPLDMPYSLFVDVCNACNFQCRFCAVQTEKIENFRRQAMTWELFKKIIDDLKEFPRALKMLRLSGQGETLINKNLPQMISYAKEQKVTEHIEIVTNASLLTPEMSDGIIGGG